MLFWHENITEAQHSFSGMKWFSDMGAIHSLLGGTILPHRKVMPSFLILCEGSRNFPVIPKSTAVVASLYIMHAMWDSNACIL